MKSKIFNNIVFSSDSSELKKIAKKSGAEAWFIRPKKLSNDGAAKMPVIRHALIETEKKYNIKFDYIFDLDVTSPLRKISDIKKAFTLFLKSNQDMLISGNKSRKILTLIWSKKKDNSLKLVVKPKKYFVRTQDAPIVYELNASIYIWKRRACILQKDLFVKKHIFMKCHIAGLLI